MLTGSDYVPCRRSLLTTFVEFSSSKLLHVFFQQVLESTPLKETRSLLACQHPKLRLMRTTRLIGDNDGSFEIRESFVDPICICSKSRLDQNLPESHRYPVIVEIDGYLLMLGAALNQKNRDLGSEFSRSHPREYFLSKDTFIQPKRPLGDSLDKLFELALLLSMTEFLLRQAHDVLVYPCKDVSYIRLGVAGAPERQNQSSTGAAASPGAISKISYL